MRKTTLKTAAVAFAAAVLATTMGATAAHADPSFTPDADDLVGTGSDTTQFVTNNLAEAYNAVVSPSRRLASFDATGSATITPRAGAAAITRPNGSSAGIAALAANATLDFARSSSGPASYDAQYDGYTFYALATDAVSVAVAQSNNDGTPDSNAPDSLVFTSSILANIYRCAVDQWSDLVPGASSATIAPLLPQSGSGTRRFFLEQIGVTEAQVGACVTEVQEHDAAPINSNANALAPFSEARYNAEVASVNGSKIIELKNTGGNFRATRTVYNVVRTAQTATFDAIFGADGFACGDTGAAVIEANGFEVSASCGAKTAI